MTTYADPAVEAWAELLATRCTRRMWGDATGLRCTVVGAHRTHRFEAAPGDDTSEPGSCEGQVDR